MWLTISTTRSEESSNFYRAYLNRGQKRLLYCAACDKTFQWELLLRKHYNAVHIKQGPCESAVRENVFAYKPSLNTHVRAVNLGSLSWTCTFKYWGKLFSEKVDAVKPVNICHAGTGSSSDATIPWERGEGYICRQELTGEERWPLRWQPSLGYMCALIFSIIETPPCLYCTHKHVILRSER